ncbi:hypothetical protein ACFL4T_08405 [candidate division KSB1 bacterium]
MKTKLFFVFLFFALFQFSSAQVPDIISYQGILKDSDGMLVCTGTYSLTFKIYDSGSSGTELWTETQSVNISNGVCNVELGSVSTLDISFDRQYWLGITINSGTELTPRTKLMSVPYSLNTRSIPDSIVTTDKIKDNSITTSKISSSGASAGEVITYDGTDIAWDTIASPEIVLPYSGSTSSSNTAFSISTAGSGNAGYFEIDNSSNYNSAIYAKTTGTGFAGYFRIENPSNSNQVIYARTNGTGKAGLFNIENSQNSNPCIYAITNGLAQAMDAVSSGFGNAGRFRIFNSENSSYALNTYTNGTGHAGYFEIDNAANANHAVYATTSGTGKAGYFNGDVHVTGDLNVAGTVTKGGGAFAIDHPLDPENKILKHSFVESPEMMNIYKGRAKLVNGEAVIQLPDYFDALNHPEDRVLNLTCINGWSPLFRDGEIKNNQFFVKTTKDGEQDQEFDWVVYAKRNDKFAQENPIVVEEEKGVNNTFKKGEYLHPKVFGQK